MYLWRFYVICKRKKPFIEAALTCKIVKRVTNFTGLTGPKPKKFICWSKKKNKKKQLVNEIMEFKDLKAMISC